MSRSRLLHPDRPSLSLIITAAMGMALLAVPVAQAADAATPKCFGKKATIVGTNRSETIRGTMRADVIVAKGGKDTIVGRGGNDLICAGIGADVVRAGGGRDLVSGGLGNDAIDGGFGLDRLKGLAGNDTIHGRAGNDVIVGGSGTDTCYQNAGTGTIKSCEAPEKPVPEEPSAPVANADLAVSVEGPKQASSGDVTFTVTVANHGPDSTSYTLALTPGSRRASCDAPAWVGEHAVPALAAGAHSSDTYVIACTKDRNGARVSLRAAVSTDAVDPVADNDTATAKTRLK